MYYFKIIVKFWVFFKFSGKNVTQASDWISGCMETNKRFKNNYWVQFGNKKRNAVQFARQFPYQLYSIFWVRTVFNCSISFALSL